MVPVIGNSPFCSKELIFFYQFNRIHEFISLLDEESSQSKDNKGPTIPWRKGKSLQLLKIQCASVK